jgi:hypothetical protein
MRRLLWIVVGLWVSVSLSLVAQGEEWNKTFSINGQAELRVET